MSPGPHDEAPARPDAAGTGPRADADPWRALLQAGTQLVSAPAAAGGANGAAHPWIERDPGTGARSLRMPLPPPEITRPLADALSALAEGLRGRVG